MSSELVFQISYQGSSNDGVPPSYKSNFPVDMAMIQRRDGGTGSSYNYIMSRPTQGKYLITSSTAAEGSNIETPIFDYMDGYSDETNLLNTSKISYMWRRQKGFFDVVAYTGNGVGGRTVNHNLGVVPEMIWVKSRSDARQWQTYDATNGATGGMDLDDDGPWGANIGQWNDTEPTSKVITVGNSYDVNSALGYTYIAYLFATLAGISKVGSYTGNGTSQTINAGFTTSSKFVLVKRTDSAGDWYFWDSVRGIVAGNDPHLSLNTTAAEVTTDDSIDPDASGFIVNQNATTNINVSSATYIYYSISEGV